MSTAFEKNSPSGDHQFVHYNPKLENYGFGRKMEEEDQSGFISSSSSSSSIGRNSDDSSGDEEEVQSELNKGPLESLNGLEEALPIKRSISNFYSGKSKSFTSLSDVASLSSINDITKAENAYSRRQRNLLAFSNIMNKNHDSILRSGSGGIAKRPSRSRSMLSIAVAAACSESDSGQTSYANSSSPSCFRPPLPPHARKHSMLPSSPHAKKISSCRSFSLSDLQGADTAQAATPIDQLVDQEK